MSIGDKFSLLSLATVLALGCADWYAVGGFSSFCKVGVSWTRAVGCSFIKELLGSFSDAFVGND